MTLDRQRALAEITFNMGLGHLLGFHRALLAMQTQRWDQAAAELLDSDWHSEVGARAERLAAAMRGPAEPLTFGADLTRAALAT
jgi:lysozyme